MKFKKFVWTLQRILSKAKEVCTFIFISLVDLFPLPLLLFSDSVLKIGFFFDSFLLVSLVFKLVIKALLSNWFISDKSGFGWIISLYESKFELFSV